MADRTVSIDLLGRDRASKAFNSASRSADRSGKAFSSLGRLAVRSLGGVGLVGGFAKAISSAKDFDLTMRQVGNQTKQSGTGLKDLSALAIKMGRDTVFSAQDASQAMLGLAKAGLSAAVIKGGALASTLTLASAGGLDLATSATFMSNALNTFGLRAKASSKVAAALAGGANASTASVESLGLALSQVGPGAKNAGVSLQETTAVLAAFDNAGIKGSDAGTSFKTMLQRLVPSTVKAKNAAKDLGLSFVKNNGAFKSIAAIAQNLRNKLGPLTQAEKAHALQVVFGSDATRAATVLANLGRKGVEKYTKATSDTTAAQKLAKVATEGASGAWENLKGTAETLAIQVGTKLLPAFTKMTTGLSAFITGLSTGKISGDGFNGTMSTLGANVKAFGAIALPVVKTLGAMLKSVLGLPAPILATAAAFLVAKSAVGKTSTAFGNLQTKFANGKGGLGGIRGNLKGLSSMVGGPWTLALTAGIGILGHFIAKHAAAKARVDSLTTSLDLETGAITGATKAQVFSTLVDSGAVKAAKALNIDLKDLQDAALGNSAAQARVEGAYQRANAKIAENTKLLHGAGLGGKNQKITQENIALSKAVGTVGKALGGTNKELAKARAANDDYRAAMRQAAAAVPADAAAIGKATTVGLAHALKKGAHLPISEARGIANRVAAAARPDPGKAISAGDAWMLGLVKGLRQGGAVAISVAQGIANRIVAVTKQAHETSSPSKVAIRLGTYFSEGLAIGIKKGGKKATQAIKDVADSVKAHLSDLRSQGRDIFSSAAGNVRGILDVSGIGAPGTSPSGVLAGFAAQAGAFAKALARMAKIGLAPAIIAAVAAAGPSALGAANAFANESKAQVRSDNASVAAINRAAASVGATARGSSGINKKIDETNHLLRQLLNATSGERVVKSFRITKGGDLIVEYVNKKNHVAGRRGRQ